MVSVKFLLLKLRNPRENKKTRQWIVCEGFFSENSDYQTKYSQSHAGIRNWSHKNVNEKFYVVIKIIFTHGESKES